MQKINYIIILVLMGLSSCKSRQLKNYANDDNSNFFKKFDFVLDANNYAGYEYADDSYDNYGANGYYKLKTGGAFSPSEGKDYYSYYVIPPVPNYFSYYYRYFENGNLQFSGKIGGFKSGIAIGKWKYYDEKGKLTEVDEDKKFGL